jgi:hypothetical protein
MNPLFDFHEDKRKASIDRAIRTYATTSVMYEMGTKYPSL